MSNELRVNLVGDASKLTKSLNTASAKLQAFGKSARKIGSDLSLKLTAPLGIAAGVAVNSAAKFEKLQTTLSVLTGSAEKGAVAFEKLVKFSAKTPFQLDELVKANNTMMGFGISAEDAFKHLQAIGDISAVSGGDLQGITVAFSQVAAAGRLMGQDLLQLINNGVPIIDMLSSSMGVAKSEIKEMVSEGAVTFPVLLKAFQDATSEGGKFEGGMETLSGTISGLASTLKDNLNIAFAELGQEIVTAFDLENNIPKFIDLIGDLTKKFKNLSPETKKTIIIIGGIAAALGPALIAIGALSTALGFASTGFGILTKVMMANPFVLVAVAVVALTGFLIEQSKKLAPLVDGFTTIKNLFKSLGNPAKFVTLQLKSQSEAQTELNENTDESNKAIDDLIKKQLEASAAIDQATKSLETQSDVQSANVARPTVQSISVSGSGVATTAIDPALALSKSLESSNTKLKAQLTETEKILQQKQLKFRLNAIDFNTGLTQIFENGLQNLATGIGEALGTAIATGGSLGGQLSQVLLGTLGGVATQIGQMAIGIGIALEGIKKALTSLNPIVAIAAGIALVALGAFFKSKSSEIGQRIGGAGGAKAPAKFASGGIVSAPTMGLVGEYPGARSNPEVIAPLDRLKGMLGDRGVQQVNVGGSFKLKGQDLVVALERANTNRNRIL